MKCLDDLLLFEKARDSKAWTNEVCGVPEDGGAGGTQFLLQPFYSRTW